MLQDHMRDASEPKPTQSIHKVVGCFTAVRMNASYHCVTLRCVDVSRSRPVLKLLCEHL